MSDTQDGGPAFPQSPFTNPRGDFDWGHGGMSLRDWFAGKALEGMLAAVASTEIRDGVLGAAEELKVSVPMYHAIAAFAVADAMIARRSEG